MISSTLLAISSNTIQINSSSTTEINREAINEFVSNVADKVGFVAGCHLQNDKGDVYVNRPAVLALFGVLDGLRKSNPSKICGLKLYLLSDKTRKVVDEGVLERSGLPADLITWDPSMVQRVEGSVTVSRRGILWADMNFDFSNFQGHTLTRPLSHYLSTEVIAERFSHLPRQLFDRTEFNREFVIQCMAKPAKCLEFPADITADASARAQLVKNCASVGYDLDLRDATQLADGAKHRLYDRETDSDETLVRWTNELTLQRMFECTDSKEFKKYGNALNFHKKYFDDIGTEYSIAHGVSFPLGGIDAVRPLGLNALVQALGYLLSMAEDPAFADFCSELTSLEVQICENAGHFRKGDGGVFIHDETKFGGGFGCQVGPDQPYTKHGGQPVIPYHAMGHGYSIACSLFPVGGESFGDRSVLRGFLGGADTREEAIVNLVATIFSRA
jgi:hypothetical protein